MIKQLIQIFDICDVCFWQYDETSHDKPDAVSGANGITLNVAIKNYRKRYYMRKVNMVMSINISMMFLEIGLLI